MPDTPLTLQLQPLGYCKMILSPDRTVPGTGAGSDHLTISQCQSAPQLVSMSTLRERDVCWVKSIYNQATAVAVQCSRIFTVCDTPYLWPHHFPIYGGKSPIFNVKVLQSVMITLTFQGSQSLHISSSLHFNMKVELRENWQLRTQRYDNIYLQFWF